MEVALADLLSISMARLMLATVQLKDTEFPEDLNPRSCRHAALPGTMNMINKVNALGPEMCGNVDRESIGGRESG